MRFCKFCNNSFLENDTSHWTSNGKLRSRCKFQLRNYNAKTTELKKSYNDYYYRENRLTILKNIEISYQNNKLNIAERKKARRLADPLLRVKSSYGSAAKRAFAQNGFKKTTKSAKILDCTYVYLIAWIEDQFEVNMTWANYGVLWEIDHICPLHQANTYDEVVKLCSHKNLRPLPVSLNRRKHKNKTPEAELMCIRLLCRDWE